MANGGLSLRLFRSRSLSPVEAERPDERRKGGTCLRQCTEGIKDGLLVRGALRFIPVPGRVPKRLGGLPGSPEIRVLLSAWVITTHTGDLPPPGRPVAPGYDRT
jgi:hypothetical protein